MKSWIDFAEKHPKAAKWIREGDLLTQVALAAEHEVLLDGEVDDLADGHGDHIGDEVGMCTMEMAEGILTICNGHFFKGLGRVIGDSPSEIFLISPEKYLANLILS